ncbi:Uncharacterised protein [Vibrio cholerae]|nr:Uncharacterised protein [Vibrio cholerae]
MCGLRGRNLMVFRAHITGFEFQSIIHLLQNGIQLSLKLLKLSRILGVMLQHRLFSN